MKFQKGHKGFKPKGSICKHSIIRNTIEEMLSKPDNKKKLMERLEAMLQSSDDKEFFELVKLKASLEPKITEHSGLDGDKLYNPPTIQIIGLDPDDTTTGSTESRIANISEGQTQV